MDQYPIIFKRRSIRTFNQELLDVNTLKEIEKKLQTLKPLYENIETEFKILSSDDVNQRMMKRAPYYIAAFSQIKEGYLTNIGFMLQQMDLYLSMRSIATCWQGIPTVRKNITKSTELKFVILMAFGETKEQLHRFDVSEFKRKPFADISNNFGVQKIIEAARVAPSATNSQPWYFTGNDNLINAYIIKPNVLKRIVAGKYPPIDIGIALWHLKVAAEHFGRKVSFIFDLEVDREVNDNSPVNKEYVASLKLG
jgi:Putative TM nitroreductase